MNFRQTFPRTVHRIGIHSCPTVPLNMQPTSNVRHCWPLEKHVKTSIKRFRILGKMTCLLRNIVSQQRIETCQTLEGNCSDNYWHQDATGTAWRLLRLSTRSTTSVVIQSVLCRQWPSSDQFLKDENQGSLTRILEQKPRIISACSFRFHGLPCGDITIFMKWCMKAANWLAAWKRGPFFDWMQHSSPAVHANDDCWVANIWRYSLCVQRRCSGFAARAKNSGNNVAKLCRFNNLDLLRTVTACRQQMSRIFFMQQLYSITMM